jgi:hypothetical protein
VFVSWLATMCALGSATRPADGCVHVVARERRDVPRRRETQTWSWSWSWTWTWTGVDVDDCRNGGHRVDVKKTESLRCELERLRAEDEKRRTKPVAQKLDAALARFSRSTIRTARARHRIRSPPTRRGSQPTPSPSRERCHRSVLHRQPHTGQQQDLCPGPPKQVVDVHGRPRPRPRRRPRRRLSMAGHHRSASELRRGAPPGSHYRTEPLAGIGEGLPVDGDGASAGAGAEHGSRDDRGRDRRADQGPDPGALVPGLGLAQHVDLRLGWTCDDSGGRPRPIAGELRLAVLERSTRECESDTHPIGHAGVGFLVPDRPKATATGVAL